MKFDYDKVTEDTITLGDDKYDLTWGRLRRKGKTLKVSVKTKPNNIKMDMEVSVPNTAEADALIARLSGEGVCIR